VLCCRLTDGTLIIMHLTSASSCHWNMLELICTSSVFSVGHCTCLCMCIVYIFFTWLHNWRCELWKQISLVLWRFLKVCFCYRRLLKSFSYMYYVGLTQVIFDSCLQIWKYLSDGYWYILSSFSNKILFSVSEKEAFLFSLELCQISTNFNKFWQEDGKMTEIICYIHIFYLT